jgi:hypothetical protein
VVGVNERLLRDTAEARAHALVAAPRLALSWPWPLGPVRG